VTSAPPSQITALPAASKQFSLADRPVNVVSSALKVLEALRVLTASKQAVSLRQLSEALGVSSATAFRVAQTLCAGGLARQTGRGAGYLPTMAIVEMAAHVLERTGLRDLARPVLNELAERCGEAVTVAIPDGDHIVFIDRVGSRNVQFYCDVGRRLPLHVGAAARAILAHYPPHLFDRYVSRKLVPYTAATKVSGPALRQDRDDIRAEGYALSVEDVEVGITAVAVPVFNRFGDVLGAVTIANLTARWTDADINSRVQDLTAAGKRLDALCVSVPAEAPSL
jgi:DNA-binding IclR family transcriptional regulator